MMNSIASISPEQCVTGGEWYAVQTNAKHEKAVAAHLAQRQVTAFTPTLRQIRTWSDRKKTIDIPLFSCYVFVQAPEWRDVHHAVITVPGVLRWVGSHGEPLAIPNCQIDAVRAITEGKLSASTHPFLKLGQRVRVRGGCLDGLEGILVANGDDNRLVVSVDLIQQSAAVSLEGYQVVPIS
jgi:transcription termination/antitermination protein NusG